MREERRREEGQGRQEGLGLGTPFGAQLFLLSECPRKERERSRKIQEIEVDSSPSLMYNGQETQRNSSRNNAEMHSLPHPEW